MLDFITTTPYTEQATGAVTKLLQETEKHLNCPLSFGWPVSHPSKYPSRGGYMLPTIVEPGRKNCRLYTFQNFVQTDIDT